MFFSDELRFFKKLSWLVPVKLVHLFPGNVLQKRVRTFENDQKNKLIWSHFFVLAYRILASEIIIFWLFLYLKKSLVATLGEKCARTSRKYLTEQGIGVALLCFYFRILNSKIVKLFHLQKNFQWLTFVKVVLSFPESIWLNKL